MSKTPDQKMLIPCPICEGSGEVSLFKGASRFFLSNDPCPHCLGLGQISKTDNADTAETPPHNHGHSPDERQ